MPEPQRFVLGIMPEKFESSDAPALIELAAASLAAVAAVGHGDAPTLDKVLKSAAERVQSMRPPARDLLLTITNELVTSIQQGKRFMPLGEIEGEISLNPRKLDS